MTYDIQDVITRLAQDPAGAIAAWEADYYAQIDTVAGRIAQNRDRSPVVLLAGPSGSSKTSTAERIRLQLVAQGVTAHLISMDNYYISRDDPDFPRLADGSLDFEAPEGLDMPLLNEHFSILERGEDIYVPEFDFPTGKRVAGDGVFLDAEQGDVFIFEGIHALNERFTAAHPDACRVYVAPETEFQKDGETFCTPTLLRLMRRMVRDHQFRGANAAYSLALWGNVLESEKRYVTPYRDTAHCRVTTTLPYEVCVLKRFVSPLIQDLPRNVPCRDQVDALRNLLKDVPKLNPSLVPDGSILREFIGPRPIPQEG